MMDEQLIGRVPISTVTRQIWMDVYVTGVRSWRVRQFLGIRLLKFAVRIMGMNVHVHMEQHAR